MKKALLSLFSLLCFLVFSISASASTIYLPTDDSDEYLPTVKIFAYTLSYDGSLIAEGYGSGTLITDTGIVLTNNHVVENYWDPAETYDAFQICLTKSNNALEPICQFTGSLITRDPDKDLALLKMDSKDVKGNKVDFDFYLPYNNSGSYNIGSTVTVIGYPDTGGKTITYTSGLISGLISEGGVDYVKTDADISFGNSGGSVVDGDGNFIGVPTYIVGSYSAEVLGYFFPAKDAVTWINSNKGESTVGSAEAKDKLKSEILAYVSANDDGTYKNDYPPYEISLIDGWKFGNSLEGSFEGDGFYTDYYSGAETITLYPTDRGASSQLGVSISAENFPYEVTLDDILSLQEEYYYDYNYYYDEAESTSSLEEVDFNGYPALKETIYEYDWWTYAYVNSVNYYIPYGDYLIVVNYTYADDEVDRVSEVEEILDTFEVDMDKIKMSVVNVIESENPKIKVTNTLSDAYLSDVTYEYEGVTYFGATFGKKLDYDFYASIYYDTYWLDEYVGNFDAFKEAKLSDAEEWYEIISRGEVEVDGEKGFFYIEEYEDYYGEIAYYTNIFIEYDDESYVTIYYSGDAESYQANLGDFREIINNLEFSNEGEGRYLFPAFSITGAGTAGQTLIDIKNYVYEDNIKSLDLKDAFGEEAPKEFNPVGPLTRKDFVMWAVRSAEGELATAFTEFESGVLAQSFADVDYMSEEAVYIEFAKDQGAINGVESFGKTYFKPDEQTSLVAGLKIVFELYGYEVWDAPDFIPWYIPYIQLGYKEGLMPYGVSDISYMLTRGEGAFLIDQSLYNSSYSDYYYDDYLWY